MGPLSNATTVNMAVHSARDGTGSYPCQGSTCHVGAFAESATSKSETTLLLENLITKRLIFKKNSRQNPIQEYFLHKGSGSFFLLMNCVQRFYFVLYFLEMIKKTLFQLASFFPSVRSVFEITRLRKIDQIKKMGG